MSLLALQTSGKIWMPRIGGWQTLSPPIKPLPLTSSPELAKTECTRRSP